MTHKTAARTVVRVHLEPARGPRASWPRIAGSGERGGESGGARETIRRQLLERGGHRIVDLRRNRAAHVAHRARCVGEHLGDDRLRGRPGERRLARHHLVDDAAERVHVGARVDRAFAHRLLGAHVLGRAEAHARFGQPTVTGVGDSERDPEVGDERLSVVQENVLGLDVAVNDTAPVRIVERARDLGRDAERVVDGKLLFSIQPVAQRFALDVRHDVEDGAVHLTRVEQRQDVRVLEVRSRADLGEKPLSPDDRCQLGAQDFDGDAAVVPAVVGEINGGHAAGAELAVDAIAIRQLGRQADQILWGGDGGHGANMRSWRPGHTGHIDIARKRCSGWRLRAQGGGSGWDCPPRTSAVLPTLPGNTASAPLRTAPPARSLESAHDRRRDREKAMSVPISARAHTRYCDRTASRDRSSSRIAPAHGGSAETARGLEREPRQYWVLQGIPGNAARIFRKKYASSR